jgi:hypothetical protein
MENTDPLSRFTSLIVRLHHEEYLNQPTVPRLANGQNELGAALSYLTGRMPSDEAFSDIETREDYISVIQLGVEAEKFIEEVSPARAKDRNLSYFRAISNKLLNCAPNTAAQIFNSSNLSKEAVNRLEDVAANLSIFAEEKIIAEEEIEQVILMIDDLISLIRESKIDPRLVSALLKTLGILRMEMSRINVLGPEVIAKNIDILLGQGIRTIFAASDKERKNAIDLFTRFVGLAALTASLVESINKVYPAIEMGMRKLGWIPE